MDLRRYFDGTSKDLRCFCLFSSNHCCPRTHRATSRFCRSEVSVMLRWYFDGSSTVLRWYFEGFKVFLPLFLQSLLPAHPPCHLPFLHSSLYPYKHSPR